MADVAITPSKNGPYLVTGLVHPTDVAGRQTHPSEFDSASIQRLPRHVLLREFRRRIDPGAHRLGPYERLPLKRGRRVTQEELADAIGVSRVWYSVLESSNANVRPSTTLVGRLASVLAISSVERVALFYAAIPELRRIAQAS